MKFLLILSISVVVAFSSFSFGQTQINAGDVSGTWTLAESPYMINGEITIPNDSTLIIEPGVVVEFQWHYQFNVHGRLLAVGTASDTIIFTINDTTGFSNPNVPDGGWFGIRFDMTPATNDSSKIAFCKLQYGKAIGSWPDNCGGAIWVLHFDKLIISNCSITNNMSGGLEWPGGGGIALNGSNPKIINNTISNNLSSFGGGIQCYESSPIIENNIIKYNTAESGGGIVCNEYSNPNILNTIIESNTAGSGGGIICWNNSGPTLYDVTMSNNSATSWAGGGIDAVNCDLQIDSCTFIENEASSGAGGAISIGADTTYTGLPYQVTITNTSFLENTAAAIGGVSINNWGNEPLIIDVTIDKCEFFNNTSDLATGLTIFDCSINISNSVFIGNTAVQFAAGATFTSGCSGTVSNCIFSFNNAATGGGYWGSGGGNVWDGANVDFMNCTFAYNTASYGAGLGIGMGGSATTTNCIFWGNSTDQIALDTLYGLGSTLTVNYCDVQGGEDSVNVIDPLSTLIWGDGNIDADPLFVNPLISDYHLQDNSPCIGAGNDSIEIGGIWHCCPVTDIEGNPRPNPPGSMPDMGAYESSFVNSILYHEFIPQKYLLKQNYPNPFNPTTTIEFTLPKAEFVSLKIYDVLGKEVTTLVSNQINSGTHSYLWNAAEYASGIYYYKIEAGKFIEINKMLLIK